MRHFLVLCCIGVALGRPQGYNYNQGVPQTTQRLGVPDFNALRVAQPASLSSVQTVPLETGSPSVPQTDKVALNVDPPTLAVSQTEVSSPAAPNAQLSSTETHQSVQLQTRIEPENVATVSTPAPVISKYFYLHSAPEENEEEAEDVSLSAGPTHKHYRVVFIKAPSANLKGALQAFSQAQREEKTAIYVLTKKTDVADFRHVVEDVPRAPSKPEVFFIKYKTPEEAAHAQQRIQAQYDALGGTSELSDEGLAPVTSVIGSLDKLAETAEATDLSNAEVTVGDNSSAVSANGQYLPPSH